MPAHLLAIDQGTSSCRAIIFTERGDARAIFQRPFDLHYPHPGWVEQNPEDILSGTLWALEACAQYCREHGLTITALGITNQRETTILWDRATGKAIYPAIVWQDRRTAPLCDDLRAQGHEAVIQARTGLRLDPYFSATKIRWILDNIQGAQARAERGELCFGTVDSFLLWHLTQEQIHTTDTTNAARTMLFDIQKKKWDKNLTQLFNVPDTILAKIERNIADFGHLKPGIFDHKIPIFSCLGDQHAALIGQGCISSGITKSTYGTGCFALMHTGGTPKPSAHRLLTTLAYDLPQETAYALEGSIFNAGTAIQFLRDNFGFFTDAAQSASMAESLPGNEGVYFVPALTGLGAPYWDPAARGLICGLDRHSTRAHIVRAALEAQAYQTRDLLTAMEQDSAQKIPILRADGGLMANGFAAQFLADILQRPIEIPKNTEATAWGAAFLAGLRAGVYASLADVAKLWEAARIIEPTRSADEADALYAGWGCAVARARDK